MTRGLFISDLHLDARQPEVLHRFEQFLGRSGGPCVELYILGDLFDAWIGDDDRGPLAEHVRGLLRGWTATGAVCFLMRGNRDFLLGRRFARASGCVLLPDPTLLKRGDERVLLTHGDRLCTDDLAYQRWRRRVRNPFVQALFLMQSVQRRKRVVSDYRQRSRAATAAKPPAIMDVNQHAVLQAMRRHRATRLVHGHTHRPADHELRIDARSATRHVLADWRPRAAADLPVPAEVLILEQGRWWRESS